MGEDKANRLERQFHSLPGMVHAVLREPYQWMDDALRSVCGKPDELLAVVPGYLGLADQVQALADQQAADRARLVGHWSGEAFDAFNERLDSIEEQIRQLATNIRQVKQLLESGADACTEGADTIVDVVEMIIAMALGTLIVNAALSVVTFGASLAAEVAEVAAEAAIAVARVAQVVERVAQILTKIAEIFQRIAEVSRTIVELLDMVKESMAAAKTLGASAELFPKPVGKVAFATEKYLATQALNAGTGGHFHPPGAVLSGYHGVRDGYAALDDADRAALAVDDTTHGN